MSYFSLGKALLHAVIVTFLFVAIGRVFAMVDAFPNPDRIGEAGILVLCGVFAVTLAASFGLQSGRAWLLFGGSPSSSSCWASRSTPSSRSRWTRRRSRRRR